MRVGLSVDIEPTWFIWPFTFELFTASGCRYTRVQWQRFINRSLTLRRPPSDREYTGKRLAAPCYSLLIRKEEVKMFWNSSQKPDLFPISQQMSERQTQGVCVCVCSWVCTSVGGKGVVSQPGGGGGSYGVHLWTAGAGRGLWTAGGRRSAGPGQTGEAHTDRWRWWRGWWWCWWWNNKITDVTKISLEHFCSSSFRLSSTWGRSLRLLDVTTAMVKPPCSCSYVCGLSCPCVN